jgi:hypothetical protein
MTWDKILPGDLGQDPLGVSPDQVLSSFIKKQDPDGECEWQKDIFDRYTLLVSSIFDRSGNDSLWSRKYSGRRGHN